MELALVAGAGQLGEDGGTCLSVPKGEAGKGEARGACPSADFGGRILSPGINREMCLKGQGVEYFGAVPTFPYIPAQKSLTLLRMNFLCLHNFLLCFIFFKWKLKKINNFHACGNIVQNIREKEKRTSEI